MKRNQYVSQLTKTHAKVSTIDGSQFRMLRAYWNNADILMALVYDDQNNQHEIEASSLRLT